MSPVALHLLVCHVPFVGGAFALALMLYGLGRRDASLLLAADYAVVAVGLGSAIAWASGPAALSALENWIDPAARAFADRHESLGEAAMIVWGIAALVGLWGIFLGRAGKEAPRWRAPGLLALLALGLFLAVWAGHEGGRIRHDELRHGVNPVIIADEDLQP